MASMRLNSLPGAAPVGGPVGTDGGLSKGQSGAYGRAKERVGMETQGALRSLRELMAYKGGLGSGRQQRGEREIIMAGQGELGETNRMLAEQEEAQGFAAREADKSRSLSAAQAALQGAMGVEDRYDIDAYGRQWGGGQRQAAMDAAMQQLRALTGYSAGAGGGAGAFASR